LPNGKRNPAAGIMLALLAELARNEHELLKARIASGLAEARRRGMRLGRRNGPAGWTKFYREEHRVERVPTDVRFENLPRAKRAEFASTGTS
jgi:DNA invertase Pin-like site-specific DNA recombinase